MDSLPQRVCLSDQVAALIQQGISTARWSGELPSEATLCRDFQVSRVTLRRAMEQLFREGWVNPGGRGRRHRINDPHAKVGSEGGRIVRVLSPYAMLEMGAIYHALLGSLSTHIAAKGYRFEYEHHRGVFTRHQPSELERLDAQPDTATWVTLYATEPMQRWFATRSTPCVNVGHTVEGIPLSSISIDYAAMARHAAGRLFARGHRDFVYLIAEFTSSGDRLASQVFEAEGKRLGANVRIITYSPEVSSLRAVLQELHRSRPRPTAYCMGCPEHCVTVLCHFQSAGLQIPEDVAILSAGDEMCLRYTVPEVSRYQIDGAKIGRKIASLLMDQLRHGRGKMRAASVIPEWIAGATS